MDETYDAVITVQVKIPASLIGDGMSSFAEYEAVEDWLVGQAELQLQEIIMGLRAEHRRG